MPVVSAPSIRESSKQRSVLPKAALAFLISRVNRLALHTKIKASTPEPAAPHRAKGFRSSGSHVDPLPQQQHRRSIAATARSSFSYSDSGTSKSTPTMHPPQQDMAEEVDSRPKHRSRRRPTKSNENRRSKSIPISSSFSDNGMAVLEFEQQEAENARLYDSATWRMYYRIMEARSRRMRNGMVAPAAPQSFRDDMHGSAAKLGSSMTPEDGYIFPLDIE